jgi:predicted metal-dependent phosphoesterase TrpH
MLNVPGPTTMSPGSARPELDGRAIDHARWMRADLHVHSYHSGYAGHLRFLRARDCYSEPEAVYRLAKARGMDVVTITDHDSIDGCLEFLDRQPDVDDFFISEEIECLVPGLPLKVHIGAYDIDERIHREVQRHRHSVFDTTEYLRSQGVFFTLNHLLFFLSGQMSLADYLAALVPLFSAFEVRNGTMLETHNRFVEEVVVERRRSGLAAIAVGGSDAHTLAGVGTTYTEAPGRNRAEFLHSLRAGTTRVGGRHGGPGRVMREIYGVVGRYWASLVGVGRQDLAWPRRAIGLGFSAISLPAEFIPALVAVIDKTGERRRVAEYRRQWQSGAGRNGLKTMPSREEQGLRTVPRDAVSGSPAL